MGLGIGVDCEMCDKQLYLDDDIEEISMYIELRGEENIIIKHPVMCHNCRTVSILLGKYDYDRE